MLTFGSQTITGKKLVRVSCYQILKWMHVCKAFLADSSHVGAMYFTKILFYEEGYREPLDSRSVTRLLQAFPRTYTDVTKIIIQNSKNLTGNFPKLKLAEVAFKLNVALLMSSFKMTRRGAFQGFQLVDALKPQSIVDSCWEKIKDGLQYVRKYIDENAANHMRSSILVKLSTNQREHVIEKTQALFTTLCEAIAGSGQTRWARVGASKILFAALPDVALPVDNLEWDYVFNTDNYGEILATMIDEIAQWQAKTGKLLEKDCVPSTHQPTTLPSVYNVLAMSVRPLERFPKSQTIKNYRKFIKELQQHPPLGFEDAQLNTFSSALS